MPMGWLLEHILCDDSFYYFTIARTLAQRGLCSFDGIAPTNGFHPLWLGIITPVFWLRCSADLSVHLILTLSAIVDIFSLFLLVRLLGVLNFRAGVVLSIVGLYAFCPTLLSYSGALNGLDTSVNMAAVFLLLISCVAINHRPSSSLASPAAFGSLCGLSFLARTDNAIIAAVLMASVWLFRSGGARFALRSLEIAMLVVSPWIIWNVATFGSVLQVSGEAYAFSERELNGVPHWGVLEYAARFAENLSDVFRFFPVKLASETKYSAAYAIQSLALLGAMCILLYVLFRGRGSAAALLRLRMQFLAGPIVAATLFVFVHSVKSIMMRGWYYATVFPILLIALAALIDMGTSRGSRRVVRYFSLLPLPVAIVLGFWSAAGDLFRHNGETEKFAAVEQMRRLLPRGATVGSWNAGIYGYFYKGGKIVNLDGLVNNDVFPHLSERSIGAYCMANHVEFLVDAAGAFGIWDPYWTGSPGDLFRSIVPVEGEFAWGKNAPIVLAKITRPSLPRPTPR